MNPDDLLRRIETLERQMREHNHIGLDGNRVNFRDIFGAIEVLTSAPSGKPTTVREQLKIYNNALYIYDTKAGAWIILSGVTTGGSLSLVAPDGTAPNGNGGTIYVTPGNGIGTGLGGSLNLSSGDSGSSGTGGGSINVQAGAGAPSAAGGEIYMAAGAGNGANSNGGFIEFHTGSANAANGTGGDFIIQLGTGSGSGRNGRLNISTLPTSATGLSTGDVWNNSGVLTIV